jgi:ketosteroid isomerase-like protein
MFRHPTALFPIALVALVGGACRPAPGEGRPEGSGPAAPLAAADLAAIRATDSAFASAAEAGDAAGLAGKYLPDAHLMPPNAPALRGREAVQKFWSGFTGAYQLRMSVTSDEIEGRGDLAYARGHYTLDATPKGKGSPPIHDEGKFLEILRRQPDGSWGYAVDMYSSDLPAPK